MGNSANLILVQDGRRRVYRGRWAAYSLAGELLWGPRHAIAYLESHGEPHDSYLYDDFMADGGCVIDTDRRLLRFFCCNLLANDVPMRRLCLELLGVVWEGWTLGWAFEGTFELANLVGNDKQWKIKQERMIREIDESWYRTVDLQPPEAAADFLTCVGSVRFEDGSLQLYPQSNDFDDFLSNGPSLVEDARTQRGLEQFSLADVTAEQMSGRDATVQFPTSGFHLDLRTNELRYWSAFNQSGVSARVADRWPGWSTTWLRDRYEDQLAACDGRLRFPERSREALLAVLWPELVDPLWGRLAVLQPKLLDPPWGSTTIEALIGLGGSPQHWDRALANHEIAFGDDPFRVPLETRAMILLRAASRLGLIPPGAWSQAPEPQSPPPPIAAPAPTPGPASVTELAAPAIPRPLIPEPFEPTTPATGPVSPPAGPPRWWQRRWWPGR